MLFGRKKVATQGTADATPSTISPHSDSASSTVSISPVVSSPQVVEDSVSSTGSTNRNQETSSQASKQTRILVVDDDEMIRIFLRDIFWIHGRADSYDVQVSGTLSEAEQFITDPEKIPDIIFLDLMVPPEIRAGVASPSNIEGTFEFIKKFKTNPKFSGMKIVVFSGHRDKNIKDKAMSFGADDYLVKGDFMPKEIISFVEGINKNK